MTRLLLVVAFILGSSTASVAQIQVETGFQIPPLGSDTTCFRYSFVKGDTLIYTVQSADSITFPGQPVLIKVRNEVVSVICDSVSPESHYTMRITLRNVVEFQSNGVDTATRSESPWVGRSATIVIDSLGNRLRTTSDNDTAATLTPGGAFQPLLLPTLGGSCGVQNQSWLVEDTTLLVENGVPEPVFAHSTLWRVIDATDTLGRHFQQIQYTQTGLGRVQVVSNSVNLDMHAVVASFGKLTLDAVLHVPFHLFATSEDRLEIRLPNGGTQNGKHHMSLNARLREVRSADASRTIVLPR